MAKIEYIKKRFNRVSQRIVALASDVLEEYVEKGYDLTLRQLYYQFVARDFIPNTPDAYRQLGTTVSNARLAGLIDWEHIIDRTRNLEAPSVWDSPEEIIRSAADSYQIDLWREQRERLEVWVEKDALIGVIQRPCSILRVPYFSCRGFVSQSEMWRAGVRMTRYRRSGKEPVVLHLGDHDPSGIDMTRDIKRRLTLFSGEEVRVDRIGLNMDQIRAYNPPPNPAKTTDSRCAEYIKQFGNESWELDALEPDVLADLIRSNVQGFVDGKNWRRSARKEAKEQSLIHQLADNWDFVRGGLDE